MSRKRQLTRRLRIESLETRTMLSVTVLETEPNDTITTADSILLERDAAGQADALLKGAVDRPGDRDFYQVDLEAGDVIGAAVQGQGKLDPVVRFHGPGGELLFYDDNHWQNYQQLSSVIPQDSPLPTFTSNDPEAVVYYVVSSPGTYYLQIGGSGDASVGTYRTDVVIARPGMEAEPVGTSQLVYIDFDGADVNTSVYGAHGMKSLTPLSGFLDRWGLAPEDEDVVISRTMQVVEKLLVQQIRVQGLNGDYDKSGEPGEFAIEVLNSRDNPEFDSQFGRHPYLSRVVVGGTLQQVDIGRNFYAIAQHVDPGNFSFDDDAVVLLDALSRPPDEINDPDNASLNWVEVAEGSTKADLVGTAVGLLVAHETAHNFGAFHTEPPDAHPNVMNLGGPGGFPFLGPDRVFGSDDDVDVRFGVDNYGDAPFQPPSGESTRNDTLNTLAFGLSTGTHGVVFDAARGAGLDGIFSLEETIHVPLGFDGQGDSLKPAGGEPTRHDILNTLAFGLSTVTRDIALDAAVRSFVHLEENDRDETHERSLSPVLVDVALLEIT